jgi:hypothetical protein
MLDAGYWMLGNGYWVLGLDAGYWVLGLDAGYWVLGLDAGYWINKKACTSYTLCRLFKILASYNYCFVGVVAGVAEAAGASPSTSPLI